VSDAAVLDLRTYKLKPGAGEQFARILADDALPMLARFGIEVAAHGPSLDDADSYYLVRRFGSAAERNERLDAFYGSEEWRKQHRERVLALIDSFHVLLLPAAPAAEAAA
jgi:NIPSNAP